MSIASDVTRIEGAKAAIKAAIEGKGVTVPDATLLDGMAALIESIEAGGGSGGNGIIFTTGIFTPADDTTSITIQHGLGVVPDIVAYWAQESTTVASTMIFGVNALPGIIDALGDNGPIPAASAAQYSTSEIGAYFWAPNSTAAGQKSYLNVSSSAGEYRPYCAPNSANETTFQIGMGNEYYVRSAITYRWIAISGVKK